jgi:hypothetical protein
MRLYEVCNGYRGYGPVHVLVIAPDEEYALALAAERLQSCAIAESYDDDYWEALTCRLLCDDVTQEWASTVRS